MRRILFLTLLLGAMIFPQHGLTKDNTPLDQFVSTFDYKTRKDMKATSKELLEWLKEGKAILVDIRFPEEQSLWGVSFSKNIPLPQLATRYKELPKDKIIVTACPHNDRSNIAMVFLRTKGFNAKYLTDGLTGLMENLRGDAAKNFTKQ